MKNVHQSDKSVDPQLDKIFSDYLRSARKLTSYLAGARTNLGETKANLAGSLDSKIEFSVKNILRGRHGW